MSYQGSEIVHFLHFLKCKHAIKWLHFLGPLRNFQQTLLEHLFIKDLRKKCSISNSVREQEANENDMDKSDMIAKLEKDLDLTKKLLKEAIENNENARKGQTTFRENMENSLFS